MAQPPDSVGRYHMERLIAHGGMGSLYLARDPAIDRPVVIKFLKEGFDDAEARERFAREARAAGRLHHPNIVTVFDVGEHDNRPFIAMEYVSGETLAQLVERRAVRRLWEKLEILEELCAGLHYAHEAAIVHRDIKPSNVMRDQSGVVKILDFGIARGAGGAITRAGDIVGTLNYMSPEQLAGEDVDHRTDIYSVGVLAYELVTGQMAFPGTIQTGVLSRILSSAPLPIESLVPGIDPDVPAMIERAIAREPDARYPDLDTLRRDLAVVRTRLFETAVDDDDVADPNAETRFMSPRIPSGVQSPPSSRAGSALSPGARAISARPSGPVSAPPRRRTAVLLLGGACAALAIAMAAMWMLNWFSAITPPFASDGSAARQPPAASPATPASANADQPEGVSRSPHEEQVSAARVAARQKMGEGQDEQALETLIRGLDLEPKDPELNRLVDEMTGAARRTVSEARAAAAVRGATAKSSAAFREGQAREREANSRLRAGDRVPGVRAAWAAAAFYGRSPEVTTAAPRAATPTRPTVAPLERASPTPGGQPVPTAPSTDSLNTLPGRVNTPPGAPLAPPAAPKPEPPTVTRDPAADPRAAEPAAIRETLRRYTQAYQSLDRAAVARTMPSLTAEQLRDLERDFANYRRYTVEIRDERIIVEVQTATVTCEVVRSFVTKTGVAGSHTVHSIFHLRRSGSGWTIERLESR